ncbi:MULTISPECIES: phenylalanine--tRNA ligase beta subunit-related protein [unclassified Streptomyces]|uniref:phenylalanine--tRNA ligase beta subunit-related protein n=1 Tax=unclassified Streptomyces TaxID=2593676 RepID=UPI002E303427|nr:MULTISPECIES: phenylalanine--tRNA ligase beta subunit-related protein [unclassified Streptomyces]
MTLTLTVSDEVRALAPGFTHVAVEAHGLTNGPSIEGTSALLDDAPVGGEDIDRVSGGMRLVRAAGDEEFETVADGAGTVEHPDAGEVVWRDAVGVTCRRWNWRQGPRTRLTEQSTSAIFLLEGLAPLPVPALGAAAAELAELLEKFSPGARVTVHAPV